MGPSPTHLPPHSQAGPSSLKGHLSCGPQNCGLPSGSTPPCSSPETYYMPGAWAGGRISKWALPAKNWIVSKYFLLIYIYTHTHTHTHIYIYTRTYISVQFSSVAQSCLTLCDPMNSSTPGLPVHHHLPEFTQTHFHRVSDAIQPSHPLSSPFPPAPNPSQHQSLFQ